MEGVWSGVGGGKGMVSRLTATSKALRVRSSPQAKSSFIKTNTLTIKAGGGTGDVSSPRTYEPGGFSLLAIYHRET